MTETGDKHFKHLIKLVNTPWLIEAEKLEKLMQIFDNKLNGGELIPGFAEGWEAHALSKKVCTMKLDGVFVPSTFNAQPVCGLIPTFSFMEKVEELSKDYETIILELDTPGGVATGIPELAEVISNSPMEVVVFTKEMCASAGMWIASAADKHFITPSARVGSIGVRVAITKRVSENYKTYIFHAGKEKAYGDPDLPITADEEEYFSQSVNEMYNWFVESVSTGRGVEEKIVRETEARVYSGKNAPEWMHDGVTSIKEFKQYIIDNL